MKSDKIVQITLCGVQGCCPTVTFRGDNAVIRDDFGGKVRLNAAQQKDLAKAIRAQQAKRRRK